MTGPEIPTPPEIARLEAEWRRLERERKPGRLRAYQVWQAAESRRREALRRGEEDSQR